MTKNPMIKRVKGEEPPFAENSLRPMEIRKAPSTTPMISGRRYSTAAARCSPKAPALSLIKQAMQKPMVGRIAKVGKSHGDHT